MTLLRSAISVAGEYDPTAEDESTEANYQKSIRLTGIMATTVAAIHRLHQGQKPLVLLSELNFAGNFSYMLTGRSPRPTKRGRWT